MISSLLEEVQIPTDGTLSRVIFKDDEIRLVVFAFDAGQELTDHTAGVSAIIQVVRGRLALTLGEVRTEIGPSGWVHMEPHLSHAVLALEPTVMLLTLVRGS